jgi:asparagine synthase (glutamine-hydrolysing)
VSGICGICQPGAMADRARLEAMLRAATLAGESGYERVAGESVALGVSRRWSFQQTASLPEVKIAIDADLYNLNEVNALLRGSAVDGASRSLAENLARLYLMRGLDFLGAIQGAFAIALWDERKREMLLAVDRFGFKTLYWTVEDRRLLFGSRVSAVRAGQDSPAEVNRAAIMQYLLFSAVPAPMSIYRGIQRLEPGTFLSFDSEQATTKTYWDLEYEEKSGDSEGEWARKLQGEMREAVHRNLDHFYRDEVGAYLSGGTDSSSVVAFMSEKLAPVHAFSISFPVSGFNEIEYARTTAAKFQAKHHEKCLIPEDALNAIPKIISYYDEPFANSSAIASYWCAMLARENGVNTLLAGDGGDELFGGNARYATDKQFGIYHSVPGWLRAAVIQPAAKVLGLLGGKLALPQKYIRRALIPNPRRIMSYNFFLSEPAAEIFEPEFLAEAPEAEWLEIPEHHFKKAHASSELNRILYMDVKMTLADNDLRKVNGTAELAGLNVRYPLLDTKLAEFAGTIPTDMKLKGMEKRYLFKLAMKDILPREVIEKKKHGFGVPLGQWFLTDPALKSMVQEVLNDPRTRQRGYFKPGFVEKLAVQHQNEHATFYGEIIWYLVALELWHREHYQTAPAVETPAGSYDLRQILS